MILWDSCVVLVIWVSLFNSYWALSYVCGWLASWLATRWFRVTLLTGLVIEKLSTEVTGWLGHISLLSSRPAWASSHGGNCRVPKNNREAPSIQAYLKSLLVPTLAHISLATASHMANTDLTAGEIDSISSWKENSMWAGFAICHTTLFIIMNFRST